MKVFVLCDNDNVEGVWIIPHNFDVQAMRIGFGKWFDDRKNALLNEQSNLQDMYPVNSLNSVRELKPEVCDQFFKDYTMENYLDNILILERVGYLTMQ